MIPLKYDYTYAWLSEIASTKDTEDTVGFYHFDTRHLSQYCWDFGEKFKLIMQHSTIDSVIQHWAYNEHHTEKVYIERNLKLTDKGFEDTITACNQDMQAQDITFSLTAGADFHDMFVVRGHWEDLEFAAPKKEVSNNTILWSYRSSDNISCSTELHFTPEKPEDNIFHFHLNPNEQKEVIIKARFTTDVAHNKTALISQDIWDQRYGQEPKHVGYKNVFRRARQDVLRLLLTTEEGACPAAGVPWFVTIFGRDSLITSSFLLPKSSDIAKSLLKYLAKRQGVINNPFNEEEPGKILHEARYGELSRIHKVPFKQYYGTADATALWVKLFYEYIEQEGDLEFAYELKENFERALGWIDEKIDTYGFIQFVSEGSGLGIQSWKDSHDSHSHKDGTLAEAPLASVEVQGYVYAAYKSASLLYQKFGDPQRAQHYRDRASTMFDHIQKFYWLEDQQIYALALDKHNQPLAVSTSNPGHLLWCKAVPEERAKKLAKTFMAEDMYSGWGIRTMSSKELRYNPLSYHNGSIWPHDNGIIALGFLQYGFINEFEKVTRGLLDVAQSLGDFIIPEVTGGFPRKQDIPVIPYTETCKPQAWAASSILALCDLAKEHGLDGF